MKALLLAAGFGTRLGSLTKHSPKCLMRVGSQTMLDHWLFKLNALGIDEFVINTHYLAELVENFVATHELKSKIKLSYEAKLLGTAGTIIKHKAMLEEDCFIAHVDNYCDDSLINFVEHFRNRPKDAILTMLAFRTKSPEKSGILTLDDKNVMQGYLEKDKNANTDLANGAVFISSPKFLEFINTMNQGAFDFSAEILPDLIGKVNCYETQRFFIDIGSRTTLSEANEYVKKTGEINAKVRKF